MKVWIDVSASAHVLVFRPLIKLLRERGDEIEVTARDYAQTLELLERHGIDATVIGRHGGPAAATSTSPSPTAHTS
jgi:predicted glycosyltransferase